MTCTQLSRPVAWGCHIIVTTVFVSPHFHFVFPRFQVSCFEKAILTLSKSQQPRALLLSMLPTAFGFEKATKFLSLGKDEVSEDEVEDLLDDLITSALASDVTSGACINHFLEPISSNSQCAIGNVCGLSSSKFKIVFVFRLLPGPNQT